MTFHYFAFGWGIESDVPFASLPNGALGPWRPEQTLRLRRQNGPLEEPERWLYSERFAETNEPWRGVGATANGYLIRLFGFADFRLQKGSLEAQFVVAHEAAVESIEPLFLEQVLPLWWGILGRTCLHASAIVWPTLQKIVAFAGPSGSGKSTLAASLASEGGLISDDCLVLDFVAKEVFAYPGSKAVRLLSDSAGALFSDVTAGELSTDGVKRRVLMEASKEAFPLAKIYLLEDGKHAEVGLSEGTPNIVSLRGREALGRLASCYFRLDPEDKSRLGEELETLAQVTSRVPMATLHVPRVFAALGRAKALIETDLAEKTASK